MIKNDLLKVPKNHNFTECCQLFILYSKDCMIKTKRDSLENFIRSQMEGPGACNNRFNYISDSGNSEGNDVINTTPGSVYSTAVLFPQRVQAINDNEHYDLPDHNSSEIDDDIVYLEQGNEKDNSNDELEEIVNRSQSDEEDLYSLSQRFPTTIGISCCLESLGQAINNDNCKITISGRYYTKILKEDYSKIRICIEEVHYSQFESFFYQHKDLIGDYFSLSSNGISINNNIPADYQEIKQLILNINLYTCREIAKDSNENFDPIYLSIDNNYRFLKSYKERLWGKLRHLKDGEYISDDEKSYLLDRIRDVELYETFISYLEDVISIYNSKSFGFWISHSFSSTIDLSEIDLNIITKKAIFSPSKITALKNIVKFNIDNDNIAALSVWLQVTKSHIEGDDSKLYLKVQLENTSTPFVESGKHYFSIVTEQVNQRSFFGVQIKVESDMLCPYRSHSSQEEISNDVDQLNYLYRDIKDYGIGHLCSADWLLNADNTCMWIKSEFIPSFETPDVEPIPRDKDAKYICEDGEIVPPPLLKDTKVLEFKRLSIFSDSSDDEIITMLFSFVESYGKWIKGLKQKKDDTQFSLNNISKCEEDYKRMRLNVELILQGNSTNIESFRLMNSAMFIQLWHSKFHTNEQTNKDFYSGANDFIYGDYPATWRPFQLAFIILNLDGIIQRSDDVNWNARNELVDLVWFPTGGGKTEAYLGIIALTIINRRRTEENSGGTTAMMRYTLRLLANQQFRRAMRVILALEQLRRWNDKNLGDEPISIGLFVGDDSLPNNAEKLLGECRNWNSVANDNRLESKIPLDKCPWCGDLLEFQNRGTEKNPQIVFLCKNIHCTFSDSLPIMLCDEYIYQNPPTLLFGTVDKFAALGHMVSVDKTNKDSRRLFGKGLLSNLPPSLIIQDELHLLLGPLGSAVSLFECAIDQLCSYNKTIKGGKSIIIRPKIISSTATTRNTDLQIRALYDRDVNIFPKNGIDYDDSFFAFFKRKKVEDKVIYISKRKYIGILPTGRTQMTTQMRLVATMFVHRAIFEKKYADRIYEKDVMEAMDYYHSIIIYFNSLKEVGKTDAQFYTEFTKYTRRLFKRVLRNSNMLECLYGYDSSFSKSELTGRLTGSEVNSQLTEVEKRWASSDRFPHKDNQKNMWVRGSTPPDLILATNMISVGLDVDRFNMIVMNSMPRNIAEYIQASSRVARNNLGLVVTLHNPFRARDLSHFERFREFHEKLYYYVEPISITPFSKKSVEKYLPLYLATMIRHSYPKLADNAAVLDKYLASDIKQNLIKYFNKRLERTQNLSETQTDLLTIDLKDNIEEFMNQALGKWLSMVDNQKNNNYSLRYNRSDYINKFGKSHIKYKDLFLTLDAYLDSETEFMWSVPMSLRNVESEAIINVMEKSNGSI